MRFEVTVTAVVETDGGKELMVEDVAGVLLGASSQDIGAMVTDVVRVEVEEAPEPEREILMRVHSRAGYAHIEFGYADGAYENGDVKFLFGYGSELTVDDPPWDEEGFRVRVNMGAIGSLNMDDNQLRVDVYQAAVTVGRLIEEFLEAGAAIELVDAFAASAAVPFRVVS